MAEPITTALLAAIEDPAFDARDDYDKRTGHDYAFDGLWMLVVGGVSGPV
jgi:hypothetical protein